MKKWILTLVLSLSLPAFSHEGHDHDAPGAVQAPKGGVIKSLEESHVEVVSKGSDLKIYLYSKDLKPAEASRFKIKLTAELPRNKKKESLEFKAQGNMLETHFDAKGSHRYTLTVQIVDSATGHDDALKFNVEPKK
ncbi:MAG: hypothetical protein OM95_00635 [Bdellovibrio sp. ArHS]|uniref:hypothetical protein n=1 Tax=Bdellovibrio sp. ArHS TaxID=1569284 RepID=UPI00058333B3|nr:hypothetical protein [Bdellovibrio sp. ArHS]KHD90060.1 MAG: hypothetical protein OM95_00635 [Bdellovibrio sp. ArHS]